MPADVLGYAYAAVVTLGGVIGYFKAGSEASLISGIVFGGLMALAVSRTSFNSRDVISALVVCSTLLVVMGWRFAQSGKFMPAGLVSLLSLGMVIRYGMRLLQ